MHPTPLPPLQKEYYATHQVFFSKRSLYLLVFDVTDGEEGIYGLKRWLENIEVGRTMEHCADS